MSPPFITSDVARLRKVLVSPPTADDYNLEVTSGNFLAYTPPQEDAARQHEGLVRLLRAGGAEVLSLSAVLDEAIVAARSAGVWRAWLRASLPRLASRADAVTGATLLARDRAVQFQTHEGGDYRHVIDGMMGATFPRDAAVMTPRGLVLCNFLAPQRQAEASLLRFAAEFSPSLAGYPVVFDGREEGFTLEGGDLSVLDERTLAIGVGHRSDPRVAPILARRLQMDVIAVQLRKVDAVKWKAGPNLLQSLFLHLDTCFCSVGERQAVALPYFFEAEQAGRDPLTRFLRGLAQEPGVDHELAKGAAWYVSEIGWVRRYRAGSGDEDTGLGKVKLVDLLRREGWDVAPVGGDAAPAEELEHFCRVVIPEHQRQAANVVALSPGHVIAYEGAPRTEAALRARGVTVETFFARDLWFHNGGPHCLTLPLERG